MKKMVTIQIPQYALFALLPLCDAPPEGVEQDDVQRVAFEELARQFRIALSWNNGRVSEISTRMIQFKWSESTFVLVLDRLPQYATDGDINSALLAEIRSRLDAILATAKRVEQTPKA